MGKSQTRFLPFDYAVRNLGRSPGRLIGLIFGGMSVVLLVVAASAFVQGMRRSMSVVPGNRNVILLGAGSEESVERSQISTAVNSQIVSGIRGIRELLGIPFVSPEVHMALEISRGKQEPSDYRAVFRGVTPTAFLVHLQVEIVEGRPPRPGHGEIMVGNLAAEKIGIQEEDLASGQTIWFDNRGWKIVGRFRAPGTVMAGEIWIPLQDLQVSAKRNSLSCVVLTLDRAEFVDVDAWTKMRLDLELAAISEADYYSALQRFYGPIQSMVWITAGLMALAGLLGGLSTIYAAFASRTRELAMLRSLGFKRRVIFFSILQESLLVSCSGGLLACLVSRQLFDGIAVRFSMGVFQLSVNFSAISHGLLTGLLVGLLGAIPPAFQCLRLNIPEALKST